MTSHPKRSTTNINRGMSPVVNLNKLGIFGNAVPEGNSDFQAVPLSMSYSNSGIHNGINSLPEPPVVPPRTDATRSRYSTYGNMYSPYSRYSPSMFGYGHSGYRTPYNRYMSGMPPGPDSYNSFIQLAEESTRPAFESIESVVDIVSSISMMLESTYNAVYSSYHAILGVVEQFSRLRDHLAEVLSFLALLRGLKYLCLKILYLLRLKKDNPSVEAAWNTAKSASGHSEFSQDPKSPWPFFMFIGLVIGAPWLMFRLLARSAAKKPFDISAWKNHKGVLLTCYANYNFNTNRRGELPFTAGECLYIAPTHLQTRSPKGWLLASNTKNKIGLVPSNHLKTQRTTSGQVRVMITQKKDNVSDNCEPSSSNTTKVDLIPGKLDELPKDVPTNPFVEEYNTPPSEVDPVPSVVEDSAIENEEQ